MKGCQGCGHLILHRIDWNDEDHPKPEYHCMLSGYEVDVPNQICPFRVSRRVDE